MAPEEFEDVSQNILPQKSYLKNPWYTNEFFTDRAGAWSRLVTIIRTYGHLFLHTHLKLT